MLSVRSRRRAMRVGAPAVLAALLLGAAAPAANADYALLEGDGSTWSQGIVNVWIANVQSQGMQVVYSGIGSSGGRKSFANSQDDFAISEIPYQGVDPVSNEVDSSGARKYAYMPIVAGGTSFSYHVIQAGQLMRDVRLSGETIAKIFTGQITNWNDAAIASDNNGRAFPDLAITPVVRSDGSGTTAQFTAWMASQYPAMWKAYAGRDGLTSNYPINFSRMQGAYGSDQVMNTIAADSGNGTIGYVEYSYALNKDYPVAKVLNKAGYYVEPTAYNVAVALTQAKIKGVDDNTPDSDLNYLTQDLSQVYVYDDPRTYPLSSYSYMILPTGNVSAETRMTTAKRQTLVDFMTYGLCAGQQQAGAYGYSPLPLNLVQRAMNQLAKVKADDSGVNVQSVDPTRCDNPTFVAGDLTRNHLAEVAAQPADCDKQGQGPCLSAGQTDNSSGGSGDSGSGGSGGGGSGGGSGGNGSTGTTAGTGTTADGTGGVVDPETGQLVDPETGQGLSDTGDGTTTGGVTGAVSTTIAARPVEATPLFAGLSVAELLAVVIVPGLLLVRGRRNLRGGRP